jgi:hypothetical protein
MTDPQFLNWIADRFVNVIGESENVDFVQRLRKIAEREARGIALVDQVIFDLPIGEDVTYSRGYSAGVAAARESLRKALKESYL